MKIIFLNTCHSALAEELKNYINAHKSTTDIFCFQEADIKSRKIYDEILADYKVLYFQKAPQKTENGHAFSNVIYYKNIDDSNSGVLLEADSKAGLAQFLTFKYNNQNLTVYNCHGVSTPGDKLDNPDRLRQSNAIIKHAKQFKNVIIGGDFNLLPETTSVQLFTQNNYQNLITDFKIKTTRNQITFDRYPDNIQYYADYIFISPDIKIKSFTVPTEIVSDHQPLELEIS